MPKHTVKTLAIALAILCSHPVSQAYIGELSKDNSSPALPALTERHAAYHRIHSFLRSATPDTKLPPEIVRAADLLHESDEHVVAELGIRYLQLAIQAAKNGISAAQRSKLDSFRIRISAAVDGIARVDLEEKSILIPVDFLYDAWVVAMIYAEAGKISPPPVMEANFFASTRINQSMVAHSAGKAVSLMSFGRALKGSGWNLGRAEWNEIHASAREMVAGAVVHTALHEICHILLEHKSYASIARSSSLRQEQEAENCAWELMPDKDDNEFNPMGALLPLFLNSYDAEGNFKQGTTHPPAICRSILLFSKLMDITRMADAIDKVIDWIWQDYYNTIGREYFPSRSRRHLHQELSGLCGVD